MSPSQTRNTAGVEKSKEVRRDILTGLGQSTLAQWMVILGLIFGGCCSNAWALELVTSQNPRAGTLLTFAQFLLVTLVALPKQLHVRSPRCTRQELLHHVATAIISARQARKSKGVLRVAIDGVDGVSNMGFADELAAYLCTLPSTPSTIRASVDGFHNPPELRYRRGRDSPEGFYRDSYNYEALEQFLLDPLSPGGTRRYALRVYDVDASAPVPLPADSLTASENDILIFDGIFLHRPELREYWDLCVFLNVPLGAFVQQRARRSPQTDPDSEDDRRYVDAQKLYLDEAQPAQHASILVDYTSLSIPILQRSPFPFPPHNSLLSRAFRIRMKQPAVPLSRWLVKVALFFLISLLNNAAFGYAIPMAVHIIFRSGGLCANMLVGWLAGGKKYSRSQVGAVLLITAGIASATLASKKPASPAVNAISSTGQFAGGIMLLTIALLLSGALGLVQEWTYSKYGYEHWEESLFYLHFLSLPMFAFTAGDLQAQVRLANASTPISLIRASPFPTLQVPGFYVPFAINLVTQVVCVAGVNRLTARVSSLTVTLVLSVRKAVSLVLSVVVIGGGSGNLGLWGGAAAVLGGTVLYTLDTAGKGRSAKESGKAKQG
ncbi:hypothetical protein BOTBODRAFT_176127 [Botryobasidium botryosum FD-172 SS1]|uniref:Uncharacterized protein n=1 Tax=Botryobasidium botryosum (strain FD-172 SS1) TaxID=930990 RepID=A0A067MLC2_BOTB1|nr:hypothetical protein BOTBODRAFT_176127 [Botryobasidium botryosum FD-172 SS1]